MRRFAWLPLLMLAGCGGTNTTDGAQPYNRAAGAEAPIAPGASGYANDVAAVNAFINSTEVADAKAAVRVVNGLKKLPIVPRRVFLLGVTPASAEWWKKPLEDAKIGVVPVVGSKSDGWDRVVKTLGAGKLLGNGPKNGGVNPEQTLSDQSQLTSSFVAEGIRFVLINTDTPFKGDQSGRVPPIWLKTTLEAAKENSIVCVGWRSLFPLGDKDSTPAIVSLDPISIFGKSNKVRAWVSSSTIAPLAKVVHEKAPFQLAVGGGVGEDKMPLVGLIEVKKNGSLSSRFAKISDVSMPTTMMEATLWEPMTTAPKIDSTKAKPVIAGPAKSEPIVPTPIKPGR